jgi:flagellar FliL protein
MASNSLESSRGSREPAKAPEKENGTPPAGDKADPPPLASGGGFKAWLPLAVAAVAMPALAYATTHFILLPKLERGLAQGNPGVAQETTAESGTGAKSGGKAASDKVKVTVSLNKMLVNVAGTMGTRYLMTSVTLVGNTPEFAGKINDNRDQLMDLATGTLSGKTISDLEKPGARNVIRAELMTVFNNALGGPVVQEIYITEMAIQ